jgi:hypothetical protein
MVLKLPVQNQADPLLGPLVGISDDNGRKNTVEQTAHIISKDNTRAPLSPSEHTLNDVRTKSSTTSQ